MTDDLCFLPARELRRLIGAKKLSPVELVNACIARVERIDPKVNAFTITCFDRALKKHGEPKGGNVGDTIGFTAWNAIGVKDLSDTEGFERHTGLVLAYKQYSKAKTIFMVAAARKNSAIILGKTNTPEFGSGATTDNLLWGATCNPFNPALHAGGSSGGSAVAVATGMTPYALETTLAPASEIPQPFVGLSASVRARAPSHTISARWRCRACRSMVPWQEMSGTQRCYWLVWWESTRWTRMRKEAIRMHIWTSHIRTLACCVWD